MASIGVARYRINNPERCQRSNSNLPATSSINNSTSKRISDVITQSDSDMKKYQEDDAKELAKPGHKLRLLVETNAFTTPVATLIMLNGVMIGLEADYDFDTMGEGWKLFNKIQEYFFTSAFTIELIIKICAFRLTFFTGIGCGWNIMDFFLVSMSFIETFILANLNSSSSSMGQMSVLRMLRLLRLVRLVRLLKAFQQLWFLVVGIVRALPVTFWGLLLTTFVVYMGAVFTTKQMGDLAEEDELMDEYFGTVARSMFTLFQVTTGDSWASGVVRPVLHERPMMVIFFVLFVCLTQFALLNVVVAVIVEAVLKESAQTDLELLQKAEEEFRSTLSSIYAAFVESDNNKDGTLTREEYMKGLEEPLVIAELSKIGINIEDAEEMFDVVDKDASGHVTPEEFIEGCLRSRGTARSKDVLAMNANVLRCLDMLRRLELQVGGDGIACQSPVNERPSNGVEKKCQPFASNGSIGCSKDHARSLLFRVEQGTKDMVASVNGALDGPSWEKGLPFEVLEALAVIETRLVQIDANVPKPPTSPPPVLLSPVAQPPGEPPQIEQKNESDELRLLAQGRKDDFLTVPGTPDKNGVVVGTDLSEPDGNEELN